MTVLKGSGLCVTGLLFVALPCLAAKPEIRVGFVYGLGVDHAYDGKYRDTYGGRVPDAKVLRSFVAYTESWLTRSGLDADLVVGPKVKAWESLGRVDHWGSGCRTVWSHAAAAWRQGRLQGADLWVVISDGIYGETAEGSCDAGGYAPTGGDVPLIVVGVPFGISYNEDNIGYAVSTLPRSMMHLMGHLAGLEHSDGRVEDRGQGNCHTTWMLDYTQGQPKGCTSLNPWGRWSWSSAEVFAGSPVYKAKGNSAIPNRGGPIEPWLAGYVPSRSWRVMQEWLDGLPSGSGYQRPYEGEDYTDCVPGGPSLTLGGFRVSMCFEDPSGLQRDAVDWRLEAESSGLLYFFDRDNVEVLVKVLDGCAINGRHWVFVAPVTDLAFNLYVDDGEGRYWSHRNPAGRPAEPRRDLDAFQCR